MYNYNEINLEKGLYSLSGKSFSQALEEIDPSENYRDTEFGSLDAFERQLKRFNIRVNGANSDTVDKFFATTQSAILFPEFVKRAIRQGMTSAFLDNVVAAVTKTNEGEYKGISISAGSSGYSTTTSEGSSLPETTLRKNSSYTTLNKIGRIISASYEIIRQQKLDVLSVTLKSIGVELANAIAMEAVDALVTGVGTSNQISSASSTLAYSDLSDLYGKFSAFELNTIIASPTNAAAIVGLSQMEGCGSGDGVKLPFGSVLWKNSCDELDDKIVGIDKNYALEMIEGSDLIIDTDKLIDRQLDRVSVSVTVGFKRIIDNAVMVLNITD